MSVLVGLHGTAALVLLCSLLFAEEAGVPLPIVPGDVVLIAGGLLIAHGSLSPWIFVPAACVATMGGALTAYSWASALGSHGLEALAQRFRAGPLLDRAGARVQSAGPVGIAVCRLLPGLRVYTAMVAGAVGVSRRVFLAGAAPAVVIWVVGFTLLGVLVGVPAEHALSRVQRVAAEGAVLAAIGAVAYLGIRHIPSAERSANALSTARPAYRLLLALAIDAGIVATAASGITEIVGDLLGLPDPDGIIDLTLVVAAILLLYVAAARRSAGGTAGEYLLDISYRPRAVPRGKADYRP